MLGAASSSIDGRLADTAKNGRLASAWGIRKRAMDEADTSPKSSRATPASVPAGRRSAWLRPTRNGRDSRRRRQRADRSREGVRAGGQGETRTAPAVPEASGRRAWREARRQSAIIRGGADGTGSNGRGRSPPGRQALLRHPPRGGPVRLRARRLPRRTGYWQTKLDACSISPEPS